MPEKTGLSEIDTLLERVEGMKAYVAERVAEGTKPLMEELKRVTDEQKRLQSDLAIAQRKLAARTAEDGRIRIQAGRLAGYDLHDLSLLGAVLKGRVGGDRTPSPQLLEAMGAARKELAGMITPEAIDCWADAAFRAGLAKQPSVGPYSPAGLQFRQTVGSWQRALQAEYRKALDTATTGAGTELVPTFEDASVWADVHLATMVLPLFPQQNMPTNPYTAPIQFNDTNWYPTTENVQVTTTDLATQKATLTAYGLKTGVPFSDELEEDAIIRLVPELRAQLVLNAAESIDDVLLNADTTVTNGINSDGGTIAKTTAGKAHWLLGFDGLRHLALVDNSANQSSDINAALSAAVYNLPLSKLGKYGAPQRMGDNVFIVNVDTGIRSLAITTVMQANTAGQRFTLSSGEITQIFGLPVIYSAQFRLADTDGKVTSSGNVTNTGSIMAVNTTQWRVGFRRGITAETQREAGKSQTTLYTSYRIAFMERSGTRSTATHTAMAFDILLVTAPV